MSSVTTLTSNQIAQYVLLGAVIGTCAPIFIRNVYYYRSTSKSKYIKMLKAIMAFFMAFKSALFIVFSVPNGANCEALGRSADTFYHVAMVAGDAVLLHRILAVVPFYWKRRIKFVHVLVLLARVISGVVDVARVHISFNVNTGSCDYRDSHIVGIFYTTLDTAIDFYATCAICLVLIRHMRKLNRDGLVTANTHRYIAITIYNGTRTFLLTIVNLLAAVGIALKQTESYFIPLVSTLWPITNLLFVSLIGYDTDFTEVIRNMRTQFEDKPISMNDVVLPPCPDQISNRRPSTPTIA